MYYGHKSLPWASGRNPYFWEPQRNNFYGHEFLNVESAKEQIKWAIGSYKFMSVERDKAKIGIVKFNTEKSAVNCGNVIV